jgi:hypothetical protein
MQARPVWHPDRMALLPDRVTVGTTATELTPNELSDSQLGESSLVLKPPTGTTVYIGPAGVTAATGYPVDTEFALDLHMGERVYGILASGSAVVPVLVTGA